VLRACFNWACVGRSDRRPLISLLALESNWPPTKTRLQTARRFVRAAAAQRRATALESSSFAMLCPFP
jgi:hypothetical protein